MKMLSEAVVSGCDLGRVRSSRDLIFILNVIRHSVGRYSWPLSFCLESEDRLKVLWSAKKLNNKSCSLTQISSECFSNRGAGGIV